MSSKESIAAIYFLPHEERLETIEKSICSASVSKGRNVIKIGFIGLGNVGGKLAAGRLRNSFDLTVHDLDRRVAAPLLENAARRPETPKEMAEAVDMIITCLPSPVAGATVMEAEDGILAGLGPSPGWGREKFGWK